MSDDPEINAYNAPVILMLAIHYVRIAGLQVHQFNSEKGLVIVLPQMQVNATTGQYRLERDWIETTPATEKEP